MDIINVLYTMLVILVVSIIVWDIKYNNNKKEKMKMNIIKRWLIKWLGIDKKLDINKRNIYIYDIQQRVDKIESFIDDNNGKILNRFDSMQKKINKLDNVI